jgi:metal-responsive CopG/Arc/MetJ family transcriptional regulator
MAQKSEAITFLEEPGIVVKIDSIAKDQGSNRSAFIRAAIRDKIRREERNSNDEQPGRSQDR